MAGPGWAGNPAAGGQAVGAAGRLSRRGRRDRPGRSAPFLVCNGATVLLIMLFSVGPLAYVGYLSLVDLKAGQVVGAFVGMDNYRFVLQDRSTITAFQNTFYFSTVSVILATAIGTGIALLLDSDAPWTKLLLAAAVLPWAIPEVVNALMWKWIFDFHWGALNAVLKGLRLIDAYVAWFSTGVTAMHALIFAYSWKLVPFVVLTLYAALRTISPEVIESAQLDGAGAFGLFRYVTLPLIMPAMAVAILLCVIFSMRAFDLAYLLTRGGPGESTTVLSYYTYAKTFEFGDFGAGSAVSVVLAASTFVIIVLYWWMLQRAEPEQ